MPGAVRAEQAEHLARLDREVDAAQRLVRAVGLAQAGHRDGVHRSTTAVAAGCEGAARSGEVEQDLAAVRLVADGDDRLAASGDRLADGVGGRARREPLVDLGLEARGSRDLLGRLTRPQQRAAEDGVGRLAREVLAERSRRGPAGRGQRAQRVRLAGRCLGVADEDQAHAPSLVGLRRRPAR